MKNPLRLLLAAGLLAVLVPPSIWAADVRVLAINPMRGPLSSLANSFGRDTGHRVEILFGTPNDLIKRLAGGETADVVVFTRTEFEGVMKTGKVVEGSRVEVGRVGVAVMVRAGAATPDVSTPDALKKALLDADSIAFNQRASGTIFAGVLERLGIAAEVKGKTKRPEADAGVFENVRTGKGKDLGILSVAAIMGDGGKTVRLVGPLPGKLQTYEPYVVGLTTGARSPEAAKAFFAFLTSPQTKAILAKRGVEQAR